MSSPRGRRSRRSDGEITRARVVEAAVECILENGYYESSSNAIARRAGVTWGTLQHQFGTRQGLLLEVLDDGWRRLLADIEAADVSGATLEDRLHRVMAVLEGHYGHPSHLVLIQIMLDLQQAPGSTESTRRAVVRHGQELVRVWQPLFAQALGDASKDEDLVRFAFLTIRGYLSSNMIAARLTRTESDDAIRELLVRGVACAIRERAAERGLDVDAVHDAGEANGAGEANSGSEARPRSSSR